MSSRSKLAQTDKCTTYTERCRCHTIGILTMATRWYLSCERNNNPITSRSVFSEAEIILALLMVLDLEIDTHDDYIMDSNVMLTELFQ